MLFVTGIIFILILLAIVFLMPSEARRIKQKRKKPKAEPTDETRVLEEKAVRLEKHIRSLQTDIFGFQKNEKELQNELTVERVKVKKFQEKLSQEKEWYKKEQSVLDKKGKEFQKLKTELTVMQENFSTEHAANIRLKRELKELKQQNDNLTDKRRAAELENAQLKAKNENHRRDIAHLQKENKQLSKKNEDTQWVTKDAYEQVRQLLVQKETELKRMSRESQSDQ